MDPTEELAKLWRDVFGEPPPIVADVGTLSQVLVRHLDPAPPYRPRPAAKGR